MITWIRYAIIVNHRVSSDYIWPFVPWQFRRRQRTGEDALILVMRQDVETCRTNQRYKCTCRVNNIHLHDVDFTCQSNESAVNVASRHICIWFCSWSEIIADNYAIPLEIFFDIIYVFASCVVLGMGHSQDDIHIKLSEHRNHRRE